MEGPLVVSYTVIYEDVEDGWVMARIAEKAGAISQGRDRAEARSNVRDALREILLHEAVKPAAGEKFSAGEPLHVTIAP